MTLLKVNNRPVVKSWSGLVNDLFADFDQAFGQTKNYFSVPVNILEKDSEYLLEFSAPGRVKENFDLHIENNTLTISYNETSVSESQDQPNENEAVKKESIKSIRKEFSSYAFKRSFTLDDKIDADNILAKYEDGILKVTLPKKEERKPSVKQISIQ